MKLVESLLTPNDLYCKEINPTPRLAVVGTCVSAYLAEVAASKGFRIDHYLFDILPNASIPNIQIDELDGVIIHLTLRHILGAVSGFDYGDVSYINSNIDELTFKATDVVKEIIDSVNSHYAGKVPLFFLSFIEPTLVTKGFFHNNRSDSIYRFVRNLNDAMELYLSHVKSAYYTEINDIFSYYGTEEISDSFQFFFTHSGNIVHGNKKSELSYLTIVQRVINAIETLRANDPIKLIITDLDDTLWMGVPAEEDEIIRHRHNSGWPFGYVEALLECKRRGIVLAICSKNNEPETIVNLKKIWSNVIEIDDFFSIKINWKPKSENIREILNEANMLPSNTLFIDDNLREIEEVKSVFPDIRTLPLPQHLWRNYLLHAPQTQSPLVTSESNDKTELLKAKVIRDKVSLTMDRDSYLSSLELKASILKIRSKEHPRFLRAIELINKTNQFNSTGIRWSQNELTERLQQGDLVLFAMNVEDRFVNNGLTALAVVSGSVIIQFVMSCRIFGLGVETALLNVVNSDLLENGSQSVSAFFKDTGRNASCRDFYHKHGFTLISEDAEAGLIWGSHKIPPVPSWITVFKDQNL